MANELDYVSGLHVMHWKRNSFLPWGAHRLCPALKTSAGIHLSRGGMRKDAGGPISPLSIYVSSTRGLESSLIYSIPGDAVPSVELSTLLHQFRHLPFRPV